METVTNGGTGITINRTVKMYKVELQILKLTQFVSREIFFRTALKNVTGTIESKVSFLLSPLQAIVFIIVYSVRIFNGRIANCLQRVRLRNDFNFF